MKYDEVLQNWVNTDEAPILGGDDVSVNGDFSVLCIGTYGLGTITQINSNVGEGIITTYKSNGAYWLVHGEPLIKIFGLKFLVFRQMVKDWSLWRKTTATPLWIVSNQRHRETIPLHGGNQSEQSPSPPTQSMWQCPMLDMLYPLQLVPMPSPSVAEAWDKESWIVRITTLPPSHSTPMVVTWLSTVLRWGFRVLWTGIAIQKTRFPTGSGKSWISPPRCRRQFWFCRTSE